MEGKSKWGWVLAGFFMFAVAIILNLTVLAEEHRGREAGVKDHNKKLQRQFFRQEGFGAPNHTGVRNA